MVASCRWCHLASLSSSRRSPLHHHRRIPLVGLYNHLILQAPELLQGLSVLLLHVVFGQLGTSQDSAYTTLKVVSIIFWPYPLPFIRAISSFIQKPSPLPEEELDEEPDDEESQKEKQPLAVILYVSGVSERIRKACEKYNLKVVFKSGPTLCSLLTKV